MENTSELDIYLSELDDEMDEQMPALRLPKVGRIRDPKEEDELILDNEEDFEIQKQIESDEEFVELKITPDLKYYEEWNWGSPRESEYGFEDDFRTTGWVGNFHMDKVLSYAIAIGASDVHLTSYHPVAFSILGDISRQSEFPIPDGEVMQHLVEGVLTKRALAVYSSTFNYDTSYIMSYGPFKGARFRASVGRSFDDDFINFRVINEDIPTIEDLKVEEELVNWSKYPNGLFLISGSTGTGKSTTLASIIREIQLSLPKKIITIEDPVEYMYPLDGKSIVVQREVGRDIPDFYAGLTAAMRQAPDIIMIGEVRNTEEVTELIRAAETGHLAISTMHTNSVSTTLNRIQGLFTGSEQRRIMSTLGDSLRGLANQVLVKDLKGGRFAVREILTVNEEVRKLISDGNVEGVRDYMKLHKITMEDKLVQAVLDGRCTYDEAYKHTAFPDEFIRIYNEATQ